MTKGERLQHKAKELAAQIKSIVEAYIFHHAAAAISKAAVSDDGFAKAHLIDRSFGQVGEGYMYSIDHYYLQHVGDKRMKEKYDELWAIGALVQFSNLVEKYNDLKRSPIMELIIHCRNSVVYNGNSLKIFDEKKLKESPANNFNYAAITGVKQIEVLKSEEGRKVLFDFILMEDLVSLFNGVIDYLENYEFYSVLPKLHNNNSNAG